MANRDIITRTGAAAALTAAQHDQNLNSISGTCETATGATRLIVYTDQNKLIELNNAAMVCTLDAKATIAAAIDTDGFMVAIKNINAANASVVRSGADTIDGGTSLTLKQYEAVILKFGSSATAWEVVGRKTLTADFTSGTINGVTIGGTTTNTGTFTTMASDTITEKTAAAGVTVDGLKIKDAGFAVGSDADGDLYYRGSGALARLAPGSFGQFLRQSAGAAPEWAWAGMTMVTAASVGTGTSITQALSGTVERIEIAFYGVSLSGNGYPTLQLGTGGALTTSGYVHACFSTGGNQIDTSNFDTGVALASRSSAAGDTYSGAATLTHLSGNRWQLSGSSVKDTSASTADVGSSFGGAITLAGALNIVGIAATAGNLDAGYWKVSYQRSA